MKIINKIKNLFRTIDSLKVGQYSSDNPKVLSGKILAKINSQLETVQSINDVEFKVFSQWGDDGIIQYLISKIEIKHKTFVEFGVEYYTESNTRFLLINNNWSGLVIDGSDEHINYIKKDSIYWQHELFAIKHFITAENIEGIIDETGFNEELGILSIDIDGNDYWVWKAIAKYKPVIVIVEYNAIFGSENPWTLPYVHDYMRERDTEKKMYWGSSLNALCILAENKGYDFVGCNLNGNNAYFVRKDKNSINISLKSTEGFKEGKYREYFLNGKPINGNEKGNLLKGLPIFNILTNDFESIN